MDADDGRRLATRQRRARARAVVDVCASLVRASAPCKWIPPEILSRGEQLLSERSTRDERSASDRDKLHIVALGERGGERFRITSHAGAGLTLVLTVERDRKFFHERAQSGLRSEAHIAWKLHIRTRKLLDSPLWRRSSRFSLLRSNGTNLDSQLSKALDARGVGLGRSFCD